MTSRLLAAVFCLFGFLLLAPARAQASVTITGTVGSSGDYLVTGSLVNNNTHTLLKITFEDLTPGTNLALCAGTAADFSAGKCKIPLNGSGGPGFTFLTLVDAETLNGLHIYVLREVGSVNSKFVLTID